MYNLHFYLLFFGICLFVFIPVMIIVFVTLWLQAPKKPEAPSLDSLNAQAKAAKSDEDATQIYSLFSQYFLKTPKEEEKAKVWMQTLENLVSISVANIENIIKFQEEIERANPEKQKEISAMIANLLKMKKK
ncbi:hypothetical protein [Helicobacter anatolicus]|uniref:hypothetical protein n=1 Tax=Helicobacter anatolicus TaxID=2905874 RepID=UPI001E5D410F|nr:hypothetical protein [Helicobacter anatolicus]MCE3038414.1 hypothetical protein [Helicobacter anatolicus]